MKWITATYQPTTLFSLKPAWATTSGGKSLFLPTPYALKMALLDVAIRIDGLAQATEDWGWLCQLSIYAQLPQQFVVTNLFAKILKLRRSPASEGSADAGPFQKSIGYREYVYHPTPIQLTFGSEAEHTDRLIALLPHITYLGKRGGFVQLQNPPNETSQPEDGICLTQDVLQVGAFPLDGILQIVDDCDHKMKFDQANIYAKANPKRVERRIVLPYRLARSSRSYSLYQKI